MFNLEQAIADWRRQMEAGGIKSPQVLDELENHLREELGQPVHSGLNAPQAFEIAIRRIGEARALKQEFNLVGTPGCVLMKSTVMILAALFGMLFGMAMVLPQLGMWVRTGVLRSPTYLTLGAALVIAGGIASFRGIRTHNEARGRKLISLAIIAAGGFNAMPLILAFFQPRETTRLMDWIFCAGLAAASILFFGGCFYFNRPLPAQRVRES